MGQEHLEQNLAGIRHLLSHLHGEINALETRYSEMLLVLERLEGVANVDDLTGLLRRNAFFGKWRNLLSECERLGEGCGVLLVDIDHFKKINDTHGHPTGDEVIKKVAQLLKQFESPSCVAGRFGGEEFIIAVRGTDAEVLGVAEFIRRGAEQLHGPVVGSEGVEWRCTMSIGMASSRAEGSDPAKLLKAADEALYRAKRKGRNQVQAA